VVRVSSVVASGRTARELLEWGWRTADAPMRDAVFRLLPVTCRTVVGYHFGWWDRHGQPVNGKCGEALRPTLVLLSAAAVGGRCADVARVAAAVELVHNFSLVHDDVMSGDVTRCHRPTVRDAFGMDQAILAGGAMFALAMRMVAENGGALTARAGEWLSRCVVRQCEGQFGDLALERRGDVALSECLAVAAGRTSALLECSCALGALLAGAEEERMDSLRAFGREFSIAYQLVDDMLGIWGDPAVTGKPVGADLVRRKKSMPVVAALTSGTAAGRELAAIYRTDGPLDACQVAHASELVETSGGRSWAQRETTARLTAAATHLDMAGCEPKAHAELLALVGRTTTGEHRGDLP
jgi:geranylgeranyl diphosphate synthase type I